MRLPTPDSPVRRAAAASQPRILVVADDYVHVTLRAALRHLRADIVWAPSGTEALHLARGHRPDVAVVDLGLPDIDGSDLTRALRAEPGLHHLRIVIVTGYLPGERAARAVGADEVLGKPFLLHEFLDAVSRQLRTYALAR